MKPGKLYSRSIEVIPSDNRGWIVRIGCHSLVYGEDPRLLIDDMSKFFLDPNAFEDMFRKEHRKTSYSEDIEEVARESEQPERP